MLAFNAQNAYKYASAIAKPRRSGSPGEAAAVIYIADTLRGFGLDVREERFSFPLLLRQFIKAPLLFTLFMLLILFFLFHINPFITGISAVLILIILFSFLSGMPFVAILKEISPRNIPFSKRQDSKNIIATIRKSNKNNNPNIYILAHYDSKSQSLSIVHRIILICVSFLASLYISIQYIIYAFAGGVPGGWLYILYCLVIFSGLLLLFMLEGNHSPGAIDNASGVGVLLHLAEIVSKEQNRFKDVNITFVSTGAEEEALVGAFHFCKSLIKSSVSKERSYFINLDGVGLKGNIYCSHRIGLHFTLANRQNDFVKLVKEAGRDDGINIKSPPVVFGAAADHFPFVYEGFNAVTLSTVSKKTRVIHTHKDVMDQIELEGLEKIECLILNVVDKINDIQC